VRARAKQNKKETRDVKLVFPFSLLLFVSYGFEALRAQKASGASFVNGANVCRISPQISREIFVTFFFDLNEKTLLFFLHFCPLFAQKHPLNARIEADREAQKARRNGSFEKVAFF